MGVVKWLIGLAQWQLGENKKLDAMNSWRQAIAIFDQLEISMNWQNDEEKVVWYRESGERMRAALHQKMENSHYPLAG